MTDRQANGSSGPRSVIPANMFAALFLGLGVGTFLGSAESHSIAFLIGLHSRVCSSAGVVLLQGPVGTERGVMN